MLRKGIVVLFIAYFAVMPISSGQEYMGLEPKDNTWELSVKLEEMGIIDMRGLKDVYVPDSIDELARTLGRDDLPDRKLSDADHTGPHLLKDKSGVKKYSYVIFTLENLTMRPVIDPATNLPKINAENKVVYQNVLINTTKIMPDEKNLSIAFKPSDLLTTVDLFMEFDAEGESEKLALWSKKMFAMDVRLEKKMSADTKVRYSANVPYIQEFLRKTAEYDLVLGKSTLPEVIPAKAKIRGVAFFANVPRDVDTYALFVTGISNRYRVQREGKRKLNYLRRMVKFSFVEDGDEFEISRDDLKRVRKERVYRRQYMGIHQGERRLIRWESERKAIERLGLSDPVEKWETEGKLE